MTEKQNQQATYELWFLGDFCESGVKGRKTLNSLLIEARQLMTDAAAAGLTNWGAAEICCVSADCWDVETVWEMTMEEFTKKN